MQKADGSSQIGSVAVLGAPPGRLACPCTMGYIPGVDSVSSPTPAKKDVAQALLLRGSVFVHLDPRAEGVLVPDGLRQQPQLILQIGLDMPIPIPDLRIDDRGVYGTLSFQRNPFACEIRWESIFALIGEDGRGMVWPEDLPAEIAEEVEREVHKRKLRAKSGEPPTPEAPNRGKKPLPPYLRVVK